VVLSAFAFSPARGSEPGIGWNIASRLAAFHDLTVLSCPALGGEDHRQEVEDYLRQHGPIAGLEVRYIHPPLLSRLFQKPLISFATPFYFIGYASWQRAALAEARRLHSAQPFDLAHQLTITGFREPSYLWKLGIPFVWGPVAGASNVPWKYFKLFSFRDRIFYGLKNTMNSVHKRLKFRARRAAKTAKQIFVTTSEDRALIKSWGRESQLMLDTGAPELQGQVREYDAQRPLKLVWSGLHAGRKALPLLLIALAQLKRETADLRLTLKILSHGRQSGAWKALAGRLNIDDLIVWTGQLPRDAALEEMRDADAFVFTSVQEGTSSVVMEALALGLPVICHDACGMGIAVDETCGIKVPMISPDQSERGFAAAIKSLLADPQRVRALSAGALARASELSWARKAGEIASVYDVVMEPGFPI
jgi:glycosyltransferase involved in cell wall biosynthesis